ncbi:hypothetical protein [Paenibacillus campinasensis]|uniref:Uncharacterized protein n=1 Tax=Paenibacillus campinasensis TaxID=66347 RepID=A0A268EMZ9_9BACL|nr:hypothetical protein [Paenibacillus campinasensis]PAD74492.1 hypothetical protein CHH67_17510 [Paenibacillus campinasensis]
MKFSFEVGHEEKHTVEFEFNQFLGNLSIKVDGNDRIRDFRTLSFKLMKTYEFEVGNEEKHQVKIEKIRKLILAGFRKTKYKVYIDGILSKEYEGK